MSRIHDALKRAEQERATSTGGYVETALAPPEVQPVSMPPVVQSAAAAPSLAASPSIAAGFTYEALLARCPQTNWTPDLRTMLFFEEDENRVGAEEFRTLRSRLYQIREKLPLKRLMVTSALPKEGKSFVTGNLGQVLVRQHGRRALVIDADLRSPGLHRHLGASQNPGLSEYLLGECDEFSVLQRGPMQNLFFLPAGRVVPSASELLANGRLKLFLQRVEPLFDWIIMDTPPVIPVADSTLLANFCDGVVMVVRSNMTPSDLARRAREEFQDKLLLGVVLNGAPSGNLTQSKYYYGEAVSSQT
jgi:protein-tyrosine kinase